MSKSYNNIIPLFCDEKKLKKLIFSIATNSKNVGEPKFENESAITDIYKFICKDEDYQILLNDMKNGIGWGEVKQRTFEVILNLTKDKKEVYNNFINNEIDAKVIKNEEELKEKASERLKEIENVIGVI